MAQQPSSDMVFAPTPDAGSVPQPARTVTVGASPFTYKATARQAIHLSGTGLSALSYTRGALTATLAIATAGQMLELSVGDTIVITWLLTAPTLTVIPR